MTPVDRTPMRGYSSFTSAGRRAADLFTGRFCIQSNILKMKPYLMILLGVVLCTDACAPVVVEGPPPPAAAVAVEVGDQPYYVHGPYYVVHGRRSVWVRGRWVFRAHRRVWVHGYYVAR